MSLESPLYSSSDPKPLSVPNPSVDASKDQTKPGNAFSKIPSISDQPEPESLSKEGSHSVKKITDSHIPESEKLSDIPKKTLIQDKEEIPEPTAVKPAEIHLSKEFTLCQKFNRECQERLTKAGLLDKNNLYDQCPKLIKASVPINDSLKTRDGSDYKKEVSKRMKGTINKIKIVRLKSSGADFALRRMMDADGLYCEMNLAETHLRVTEAIGLHNNFVKTLAIVAKTRKQDKSLRVYTLIEKLEGTEFGDVKSLTTAQALSLFDQTEDILNHLLEHKIRPRDAHFGNMILTSENVLKNIDLEQWIINNQYPKWLEPDLVVYSCGILKHILEIPLSSKEEELTPAEKETLDLLPKKTIQDVKEFIKKGREIYKMRLNKSK